MNLLVTICARGGSKGIPGKNIRLLNGKPLIAYSIEIAQSFAAEHNGRVALSTDSEEIKQTAALSGLYTGYQRPASLASDTAGKIDAITDLLKYEEQNAGTRYDIVLDLDVTSPLRTLDDLRAGLETLQNDKEALNLFSVNPAGRNPYFNMVEKEESGYYGLSKKGRFLTRQSAPAVYELNASFYFYRRSFFDQQLTSAITQRSLVYVMPHTCFDLDHPVDFEFIGYLLANNKLDFQL